MTDKERGAERMKRWKHCCPICCKAPRGKHAPMSLTEDERWYCEVHP